MKKLCLSLLLIIITSSYSWAARTFYIDSVTGSDTATVTEAQSTSTPWKRAPGMRVDYGTSDKIDSTGSWTEISTNIWEAASPVGYPYYAKFDTIESYFSGLSSAANNKYLNRPYTFTFTAGGNIRVYCVGNPKTIYGTVWVSSGGSFTPSGYAYTANDTFVFKGGVTWGQEYFPYMLEGSGTVGNPITYMGGQQCDAVGSVACNGGVEWGTGYPVFTSGGYSKLGRGMYASSARSNVTIDGIKIYKIGYTKNPALLCGVAEGNCTAWSSSTKYSAGDSVSNGTPPTTSSYDYTLLENVSGTVTSGTATTLTDTTIPSRYTNGFIGAYVSSSVSAGVRYQSIVEYVHGGSTYTATVSDIAGTGYNTLTFTTDQGATHPDAGDTYTIYGGYVPKNSGLWDGPDAGGFGINFYGGSNIEIKNCWLETYAVNAFAFSGYGGGSGLLFHDNTILESGRINIDTTTYAYDDIKIYNNYWQGAHIYDLASYHGDGIMASAEGTATYGITNLKIYNNRFTGDWYRGATAPIYLTGSSNRYSTDGTQIFNNLFAYENNSSYGDQIWPNVITVYKGHKDIKIYNNTIDTRSLSGSDAPSSCVAIVYSSSTVKNSGADVRNNILGGCDNGVSIGSDTLGTVTIDSNYFNTLSSNHLIWDLRAGGGRKNSCSEIQVAGFGLSYCGVGDPAYDTLPSGGVVGSGDWHLTSSSPVGIGLNLSATLAELLTDLEGNARAASPGLWDLGAYTYDASPTTHNLTVTKSGTGSGTVTSSPAGISCGSTCTAAFNEDSVITLSQVPITGEFTPGWGGDGTGSTTRSVTMSADKAVTAEWTIPDVDAPVLSNGSPSGSLPSGTTSVLLSFNSNENCNCRFKTSDDTYANMSGTGMGGDGTTTHTLTASSLTGGNTYNYYFRCVDGTGNTDTSSLNISFSVPAARVGVGPTLRFGVGPTIRLQ